MSSYYQSYRKVGELDLKDSSHWGSIDREYWTSCGLNIIPQGEYYMYRRSDARLQLRWVHSGLVSIQRTLFHASIQSGGKLVIKGEVVRPYWGGRRICKEYYRCPYHEDLLPNWEAFAEKASSRNGIERFHISNVMLPTSQTFFASKIMPILTNNIATITNLELENCNLIADDIECISKFVKKNSSLDLLNLSKNELFGTHAGCWAAKVLAKATKKHPGLSFLNLSKTDLCHFVGNSSLKIILEGCKGLKTLLVDDNPIGAEGFALLSNFLQKKNAMTVFSMDGLVFGEGDTWGDIGDSTKTNAKLVKQTLEKNTTLEQLCLGSNAFGSTVLSKHVLSTVVSGIKKSTSLIHVDLSGNDIRRMPSIKLIAKYLAKNPMLIELNLSDNGMPTKSACVLMESLKTNTNLEHLSLRNNCIQDKCVPAFTDVLKNNTTLRSLDVYDNNLKVKTGRRNLMKALCDVTSLDSIVNNSNHTCSLIIAGRNYGGTYEEELGKINALENEGEKIRYKVVLALCLLNKDLYNPRSFDDIPLELMPNLLELLQQEVGCKCFGEGIVKTMRKKNTINRLSNLYEAIHQWPAFPFLFSRGPGKLKRKRKRKLKVADEDEDWAPKGARKQMKSSIEPNGSIVVGRGRGRRSNTTGVSYADAENSEDES